MIWNEETHFVWQYIPQAEVEESVETDSAEEGMQKLTLATLLAYTPHLVSAMLASHRSKDAGRHEVVLSS